MRSSLRPMLPTLLCAVAALPIAIVMASAASGIVIGNETSAGEPGKASAQPSSAGGASSDDRAVQLDRRASPLKEKSGGEGKWAAFGAEVPRVELRCWQNGTPIVHEKNLAAAVEPFSYVLKLPARADGGSFVYLSTWASTTCLIKPAD